MSQLAIRGGTPVVPSNYKWPAWPYATKADERRLLAVVRGTDWGAESPVTESFAERFAAYTKTKYALPVGSGTAALELAVKVLDIDKGDEIWFYGGGNNVYRFSYLYVRLYGWLAGYYDTDGFAWYVYCDWHENETIAVLKDGVVYSSPAREGLRDAIEDAQLYAMLNRKHHPEADKRAWAPDKCSHGLVAKNGGVLPLEKLTYGAYVFYGFRSLTQDTMQQAKARLLGMLQK
jgi:hypothetical protein